MISSDDLTSAKEIAYTDSGANMDSHIAQVNLILAWLWIAVGFVLGFIFGLNFHREEWLGGYTTLKRRLYRLAHISIFALAIINLLFYFTLSPTARRRLYRPRCFTWQLSKSKNGEGEECSITTATEICLRRAGECSARRGAMLETR